MIGNFQKNPDILIEKINENRYFAWRKQRQVNIMINKKKIEYKIDFVDILIEIRKERRHLIENQYNLDILIEKKNNSKSIF